VRSMVAWRASDRFRTAATRACDDPSIVRLALGLLIYVKPSDGSVSQPLRGKACLWKGRFQERRKVHVSLWA